MSSVKIQGDSSGTGVLTIAAPNTNTDRTLSLPDNTGDILTTSSTTALKVPAFYKISSADQTITSSVFTKVQFDGSSGFDTASYWDATNHRYTPQVAGYYQITTALRMTYSSLTQHNIQIFKNGSSVQQLILTRGESSAHKVGGSLIVQLNGSSDYIEVHTQLVGSGTITIDYATDQATSYVQGFLVHAT